MTTNGYKVSLGNDKNIIDLDSGYGYITLNMLKTTELRAAGGSSVLSLLQILPPSPSSHWHMLILPL